MYNNSINGVGGGGLNADLNEAMNPTNTNSQMLGLDQQQQLDNLSNLLINSWETDDAALEQYESEMDRTLNDNLLNEKEQSNQRLFQSFQTSACAVAQMFKDKQSAVQQSPQLSSWQSFQNSAGAITVLYKDSLEACRVHMDLGVCIGQQRKLKEIINWIKKKKKRTIRKDELISFLIGKQYTNTNQNQMFNLFSQTNNSNANNSGLSSNLISTANNMSSQQAQQQQTQATQQPFFMAPNRRQQSLNRQQQQQLGRANSNTTTNTSSLTTSTVGLALNTNGENSSGSNDSQAVETNSDLATFREALIMHNRSRDAPLSNRTHHHTHPNHNHLNHLNHIHNHNNYHSQTTQQQQQTTTTTSISATTTPSNMTATGPNCDDLDCFFCEQIATHIEHKRSAANFNIDMESPTRKRGRFY